MKYFSSQNIFLRKKIMFENLNISENNIIIVKATQGTTAITCLNFLNN
jgi:hypothetical protein